MLCSVIYVLNRVKVIFCLICTSLITAKPYLQVGTYQRTKEQVKNFSKLIALLTQVPPNMLNSFLKTREQTLETMYMELLRKKALIAKNAPILLHSIHIQKQVAKQLEQLTKYLAQYQIIKFIAEEFFTITLAYNQFLQQTNNLNTNISKREIQRNFDQSKTDQSTYFHIIEIGLSPEHFKLEDQNAVLNSLSMFFNTLPNHLVAIAFSDRLSTGIGGDLGLVNEQMLEAGLAQKCKAAIESQQSYFIHQSNGKHTCYIVRAKDHSEVEKLDIHMNKSMNNKLKENFYNISTASDGNFVKLN